MNTTKTAAQLAASVLMSMGYTNVAHLGGGIKAWQAAGFAVEAGDS